MEAEVSSAESVSSDTDQEDIDHFEASFVNDDTLNTANDTQVHAHYLKSIRYI